MRSILAWLRRCCKFLSVSAVAPKKHTKAALTKACPGDVVVRRQDTSRTRVQVREPLLGDVRVAQVFDSRNLLPSSSGEECVLQTPESGA